MPLKEKLVTLIAGLLSISHSFNAQPDNGSGSGAIQVPTPCQDAGYTSCCRGRNDSCTVNPPLCYCDEHCLIVGGNDCCEDLLSGTLPCCKLHDKKSGIASYL